MRAVVQRVRQASVTVDGRIVAAIGPGLLVLCGVSLADTDADRDWLARKIVSLRIFDDDAGIMNRSIADVGGELLAVSQFTLHASTRKGRGRLTAPRRRRTSRHLRSPRSCARWSAISAGRCRPACSAPTCRSRSSTTAR